MPAAAPRPGFSRWLRSTSERYLKQAAFEQVAARYGGRTPPKPRGMEVFWVRVYAPAFHRLPPGLRDAVIRRLPGSHRQKWTYPARPQGPAV